MDRLKKLLPLILLTLFVVIAYSNSLTNDFVSDDLGITREVGNFSTVLAQPTAFVRPLLYYLAYKVGGLNPLVFRLINVFFHLGSVTFLYLLLRRMVSPKAAFFAAGLFAVHPILTEAVTWISGGTFSQYGFFFLLAFYLYGISKKKIWIYVLSLGAYFMAINSSVMAVTLFLVLLLYEYLFDNLRKNWVRIIPYFLLNLLFGVIHILNIAPRLETFRTDYYVDQSTYNPLFQIPTAITSYIELLVWPDNLTLYHTELSFGAPATWIRLGLVILYLVALVFFFRRKNKLIFFWLSFFLITIVPTLTPFRIAWIVAERYVYLASIGFFVLAGMIIARITDSKSLRLIGLSVFTMIALLLTSRTIIRNTDWKNEDNLWFATARTSPSSYVNHNNLGNLYVKQGEFLKAEYEYVTALRLHPAYADALNNLGSVYVRTGRNGEAIDVYRKALELNPRLWQGYYNLSFLYYRLRNLEMAEKYIKAGVQLAPHEAAVWAQLGLVYMGYAQFEEAKKAFNKSLSLDPSNVLANQGLLQLKNAKKIKDL